MTLMLGSGGHIMTPCNVIWNTEVVGRDRLAVVT